jgi:hypothetical protein
MKRLPRWDSDKVATVLSVVLALSIPFLRPTAVESPSPSVPPAPSLNERATTLSMDYARMRAELNETKQLLQTVTAEVATR